MQGPANVARVKFNVDRHRGGICACALYAITYASSKAIDGGIVVDHNAQRDSQGGDTTITTTNPQEKESTSVRSTFPKPPFAIGPALLPPDPASVGSLAISELQT